MINKFYKRIHSRYINIFKFFFFLKYLLSIFVISIATFLLIPKFFDYEKKQQVIKNYLIDYYSFELNNYSNIEFNIFPLPNLTLTNVDLKIKNKPINIQSRKVNIFLKFQNIYNYKNFDARKILLNESEIALDIDESKDLLNYFRDLKNKINIKILNLDLRKNDNFLAQIKNITFSNYGYKKYKISGNLFDKKFKASLQNNNQSLRFKLLNTGIKANFEFDSEGLSDVVTGSSKIVLLNNILKFNFYLDGNQLKISKSNFINKKLSFSIDSLIKFNPFFKIDSEIYISEIDKNFIYSMNLDKIIANKEILKKLNSKININYKNKRFFSHLIKTHASNIDLSHGRLVFSNKTLIEGGEIVCEGESELIAEYPRLNFLCSINSKDKKRLFKKLSISKSINQELIDLNIEGSLNLLSRKVNFKNISIGKKNKVNEEDIEYFKEAFENVLFDEGFFMIFNKNKIKNFILEVI